MLYEKELPPIEYLIDDFIIKAGLTYVVGPPASFKTGLMMLAAIIGACRKSLIGFNVKKPFRTLFIDEENGIRNTKDRFVKLVDGLGIDVKKELGNKEIIFSNIAGFKFFFHHIEELKRLIKKHKPDLIIIDNIARCMLGSERDEQDVSKILGMLKPIIEEYKTSFVVIHHTRKGNATSLDDISGSRDFGGQCDNAFLLKEIGKEGVTKKFKLTQVKAKYGLGIDAINFTVQGDDNLEVSYAGTAKENIKKVAVKCSEELISWICENPKDEYLTNELENAMKDKGFKRSNILNAIKILVKSKFLKHNYGKYMCSYGGAE
jgi:RecA-family ATPase